MTHTYTHTLSHPSTPTPPHRECRRYRTRKHTLAHEIGSHHTHTHTHTYTHAHTCTHTYTHTRKARENPKTTARQNTLSRTRCEDAHTFTDHLVMREFVTKWSMREFVSEPTGYRLARNEKTQEPYGVATISRLLKTISLLYKRAVQKRRYSAKETYNLKEPTNRSHPY